MSEEAEPETAARIREVIFLPDLVDRRTSRLRDVVFDDCEIFGPAAVAILENVAIDDSEFFDPLEAMLIEVPTDSSVVGVIGLINVRIINCRLRNVAFVGTSGSLQAFRQALVR